MQLHKLKPHESRDEDGKPVYLTPAGIKDLERQLERLRRMVPNLAAETARTAAYGDRSDNAEYKQAKGSLRRAHAQIFEIEQKLKRAVAIEAGPDISGKIKLGSTVVLETSRSTKKTFEIVGPAETDPPHGRISFESPLGAALVGHSAEDVISIKTGNGEQKYRIVEIR